MSVVLQTFSSLIEAAIFIGRANSLLMFVSKQYVACADQIKSNKFLFMTGFGP